MSSARSASGPCHQRDVGQQGGDVILLWDRAPLDRPDEDGHTPVESLVGAHERAPRLVIGRVAKHDDVGCRGERAGPTGDCGTPAPAPWAMAAQDSAASGS